MQFLLFHIYFPAHTVPVAFEPKPALQQETWLWTSSSRVRCSFCWQQCVFTSLFYTCAVFEVSPIAEITSVSVTVPEQAFCHF